MIFTQVMPPGVHLDSNPEVANHVDPLFRPFLLSHRRDHAVACLAEFLPGQVLILDLVFFGLGRGHGLEGGPFVRLDQGEKVLISRTVFFYLSDTFVGEEEEGDVVALAEFVKGML